MERCLLIVLSTVLCIGYSSEARVIMRHLDQREQFYRALHDPNFYSDRPFCPLIADQSNFPPNYYPAYCGNETGWGPIPTASWPDPKNVPTLKLVQTIMRHGDRTTIIPSQCWKGEDPWNCKLVSQEHPGFVDDHLIERIYNKRYIKNSGFHSGTCTVGQITDRGYQQLIANGRTFRKFYGEALGFLPTTLDPATVYVHADDYQRTFTSAELVMQALYPTSGKGIEVMDIWTEELAFQWTYGNAGLCPIFGEYESNFTSSPQWLDYLNNIRIPLKKDIAKALNYSDWKDVHFFPLYDCLQASLCNHHNIPDYFTFDLYQRIAKDHEDSLALQTSYPDPISYTRAALGILINKIYQNMVKAISKTSQLQFVLFVGHDSTIQPLLNGLSVWDGSYPELASYITFELYQDKAGKNYVRLIHNSKEVILPGCGQAICSWDQFNSAIRPLRITNPAIQCRPVSGLHEQRETYTE